MLYRFTKVKRKKGKFFFQRQFIEYLGFAMPHSILRNDVAGRDVTRFLKLLLRKEGFTFKTTAEFEIVKSIKERACFVTSTAQKDDINNNEKSQFTLPDGSIIEVNEKNTSITSECFFSLDKVDVELQKLYSIQN